MASATFPGRTLVVRGAPRAPIAHRLRVSAVNAGLRPGAIPFDVELGVGPLRLTARGTRTVSLLGIRSPDIGRLVCARHVEL